jgi:hypothetical protein
VDAVGLIDVASFEFIYVARSVCVTSNEFIDVDGSVNVV